MDISFHGLSKSYMEWIKSESKIKEYLPGERLIEKNKKLQQMLFIVEGAFCIEHLFKGVQNYDVITEGEILGEMSFIENRTPDVSVIAIEKSTVLILPFHSINKRISRDNDFAISFYQALCRGLSSKLRQQTKLTPLAASTSGKAKKQNILRGPIALFKDDVQLNYDKIETIVERLPPLSHLLNTTKKLDSNHPLLRQRQKHLGVATLSAQALALLLNLLKEDIQINKVIQFCYHRPSFSVKEKQALLPDMAVQKTLTLEAANQIFLITGVDDYQLDRSFINKIAKISQTSRKLMKNYSINPEYYIPEVQLGLLRGIISPFLEADKWRQLSAVILHPHTSSNEQVAISLSPFESLIIPANNLRELVIKYAKQAYPYIPLHIIEY